MGLKDRVLFSMLVTMQQTNLPDDASHWDLTSLGFVARSLEREAKACQLPKTLR